MNEDKLNSANPTDAQRTEFTAAYEEAVRLKGEHVWNAETCDASIMRLSTIARELGILEGNFETQDEYNKRIRKTKMTDTLSKFVYAIYGDKSFWG